MNYYNEHDQNAVLWLQELIKNGLVPDGKVDARDIQDVKGSDLDGFTQIHLFAGISGWSYALQLAGWPTDIPIWTGSCLCQPFSGAGKQKGTADERHVWPEFRRLVAKRLPAVIVGEQVASPLGREWLAGVRADLEALGYEVGAADLCAAGIGTPHIRQRLYWVAIAKRISWRLYTFEGKSGQEEPEVAGSCEIGGMGHAGCERRQQITGSTFENEKAHGGREKGNNLIASSGKNGELSSRLENAVWIGRGRRDNGEAPRESREVQIERRCVFSCMWEASQSITCKDGKVRRIPLEPGIQLMADGLSGFLGADWLQGVTDPEEQIQRIQKGAAQIAGGMMSLFPLCQMVPGRVALLKGAGNAIVPQLAAVFLKSVMDIISERAQEQP